MFVFESVWTDLTLWLLPVNRQQGLLKRIMVGDQQEPLGLSACWWQASSSTVILGTNVKLWNLQGLVKAGAA